MKKYIRYFIYVWNDNSDYKGVYEEFSPDKAKFIYRMKCKEYDNVEIRGEERVETVLMSKKSLDKKSDDKFQYGKVESAWKPENRNTI